MSRVKQNQLTDTLIKSISAVLKNRCSLSGEDVTTLKEAIVKLKTMKKGETNEKRLEIAVEIIILLAKFLNE